MLIRFGKTNRKATPCVATIGNFDGLHVGHQAVIQRVVEQAQTSGLTSTVITFDPPSRPGVRLMRFSDKLNRLHELGITQVICLPFKAPLITLSPEIFLTEYLIGLFSVRHLILCESFRFGSGQSGDVSYLQVAGPRCNLGLEVIPLLHQAGAPISSTRIRAALKAGDLNTAQRLLGQDFSLTGRVQPGDRLGRTLGFPTANILLKPRYQTLSGVFVVQVIWQNALYFGVANVGTRPTVGGTVCRVEVHLLDFEADLYGHRISIRFLHQLRTEQCFENHQALIIQISKDIQAARRFINIKTEVETEQ